MPSPVAARRGRILVVDDQRANVEMLAELLRSRGYEVSGAYDAEGALSHISSQGVDLVISDIRMPGMDGYELTQRLRNDPATELLPVVLVTSVEDKNGHDERVKGIESGADDFLAKPVRYAELFARVRSLLRVKVLQDEVRRQAAELRQWNERLEERVKDQVAAIERESFPTTWPQTAYKRELANSLARYLVVVDRGHDPVPPQETIGQGSPAAINESRVAISKSSAAWICCDFCCGSSIRSRCPS